MPLFFFNFVSQGEVSVDDTGSEFPSLEAAYLSARRAILEMGSEKLQARRDPQTDSFEIADAHRTVLMQVPFVEFLPAKRMANAPALREETRQLIRASESLLARNRTLKADLHAEVERARHLSGKIRDNLALMAARPLR
jgi:hypothetical protein